MIKIAASVLSADFARLGEEIAQADRAGADYIHLDVMDGAFVPNITFGAPVIRAVRGATRRVFDTHLMIDRPERYLDDFLKAGSDIVTIHLESTDRVRECVETIHAAGAKAAVSIKPKTDPRALEPYLPMLDMVLVMTVEPGFGGQSFIEAAHGSIRAVAEMAARLNPSLEIEVDGGIKAANIAAARASGAGVFVVGSAFFDAPDRAAACRALREAACRAL